MSNNSRQLKFVKSVGVIHFIGIGGIGMSGMAEILHNMGYEISGSDLSENENIIRIKNLGIHVMIGHKESNVDHCSVVVKSSAITNENPEIVAAFNKKIPVVKRSEMLAEIMSLKNSIAISGSHGKTTTTSLIASLFESASLSPTVINGGIINNYGTNAYLGNGDYLIAEADESDATFIKISATIGVITNIDQEHLDFYGSFEKLKESYAIFLEKLPFYGFGVVCLDNIEVRNLIANLINKEIITYGIVSEDVDIRAINIREEKEGYIFDVKISNRVPTKYDALKNITLSMHGIHNVLNSLAAIAIGIKLKFEDDVIINGFKKFGGVKRRFTKVAEIGGVLIIDDYAHHPEEIKVTLKAANDIIKPTNNKVIAIMQPHRYSRLSSLFDEFVTCFDHADLLYISEIYSAGEAPIEGVNSESLVKKINNFYNLNKAKILNSPIDVVNIFKEKAVSGDIIIFLGAGNITKFAHDLPEQIKKTLCH